MNIFKNKYRIKKIGYYHFPEIKYWWNIFWIDLPGSGTYFEIEDAKNSILEYSKRGGIIHWEGYVE